MKEKGRNERWWCTVRYVIRVDRNIVKRHLKVVLNYFLRDSIECVSNDMSPVPFLENSINNGSSWTTIPSLN